MNVSNDFPGWELREVETCIGIMLPLALAMACKIDVTSNRKSSASKRISVTSSMSTTLSMPVISIRGVSENGLGSASDVTGGKSAVWWASAASLPLSAQAHTKAGMNKTISRLLI